MIHPFLVGERIYLRAIEEADFPHYFDWLNDQTTLHYQQHGLYPNNMANMKAYYDSMTPGSINNTYRENYYLAICLKNTDEHIGNMSMKVGSAAYRYSELSLMFGDSQHRGKGYGTEAILLMSDHAFRKVNINRIQAGMVMANIPCRKAFEKAGFKYEGIMRELYYCDGKYQDCALMSKIKSDWVKEQEQPSAKNAGIFKARYGIDDVDDIGESAESRGQRIID